jgi:uncharacterized protein (DUF433 family)
LPATEPAPPLPAAAPRRRTRDLRDLIVSDPDLLGGEPCFRGTRVPVATLFDNLADGVGLEEILAEWPSLNRADVVAVLALAGQYVRRAAA